MSRVKVPTTVRNWRTITALNEMATAPQDQDMKFQTAIKQGHKTATGIQIPAKTDETRQRRIERSIAVLHAGKPR